MTLQRYKTQFGITNYAVYDDNRLENFQRLRILANNHYTSAGYDMIDIFNQRGYGIDFPNDNVSGYTVKELENALVGAKYWTQWKDNLKNRSNNPTAIYLDELFNNWAD
jgi:hypothetical protein